MQRHRDWSPTRNGAAQPHAIRRTVGLALLFVAAALGTLVALSTAEVRPRDSAEARSASASRRPAAEPATGPVQLAALAPAPEPVVTTMTDMEPRVVVTEGEIEPGQTLAGSLRVSGIGSGVTHQIASAMLSGLASRPRTGLRA